MTATVKKKRPLLSGALGLKGLLALSFILLAAASSYIGK
jgi:4-hydroxybenzoate polyprenyltransferase